MKRALLFVISCVICSTGFSQHLTLKEIGMPFQRADLNVRWEASKSSLPETVWVYQTIPKQFPSQFVSSLMEIGSFTGKDKQVVSSNVVVFRSPDKRRQLILDTSHGIVYYENPQTLGTTNLAKDVPSAKEAVKLTSKFLNKLGINQSDILQSKKTSGPQFNIADTMTTFIRNGVTITNTEQRAVRFRRRLNTGQVIGAGGNGEIVFGEHGKIFKIDLSWPNLKPFKSFPVATQQMMAQWMRGGRAVDMGMSMNEQPIDWHTVKSVTVKEANLSFYGGVPSEPAQWLIPLASLWTTVDRDNGTKVDLEIDCPIYESETR